MQTANLTKKIRANEFDCSRPKKWKQEREGERYRVSVAVAFEIEAAVAAQSIFTMLLSRHSNSVSVLAHSLENAVVSALPP